MLCQDSTYWRGLTCAAFSNSAGIAQSIEHPTEKPGAILTRVRIPGAARDFSPRANFQCKLSYGVSTAHECNRIHQHTRTFKIPNTDSHTIVWRHENTTHTARKGYIGLLLRLLCLTSARDKEVYIYADFFRVTLKTSGGGSTLRRGVKIAEEGQHCGGGSTLRRG